MQSFFQAPEPFCTSFLVLSYESRGCCGKAVAQVWDTGEMKPVDNKGLRQLESMAPVLPAQKWVLFSVWMGTVQKSASDQRDWSRWAQRKAVSSQAKIQTMINDKPDTEMAMEPFLLTHNLIC